MAKLITISTDAKTIKKKSNKIRTVDFKIEKCVFYTCLRPSLRLSRWFGFFPVEGLDSSSITGLRYKLRSAYSIYSFLTVLGQISMTSIALYRFLYSDLSFPLFAHFVFYVNSLSSSFIMIRFAKIFPLLIKNIADMEQNMTELLVDKNLFLKTTGLGLSVLLFGFIEHLLCIIFGFCFIMHCLKDFSFSYEVWKFYFVLKFSRFPDNSYGTLIAGMLLEITNTQATFMWTFMDVIVILISVYLVICLRNFNKIIHLQKNFKTTDWGQLRKKYSHIVALVKNIDYHFNLFVLQSFFTNLFFACLQLFNTIRNRQTSYTGCDQEGVNLALDHVLYKVYYLFSFSFLIVRTVVVATLAADVNSAAYEPISALGEIHATEYNIEIQRFYRQLTYTTIGLSGVFFYVTRQMILKVIGTFVTYELMLLQLKPPEIRKQ